MNTDSSDTAYSDQSEGDATTYCGNPDCHAPINQTDIKPSFVFQKDVDHPDNLITLCHTCQDDYSSGKIIHTAIQTWKVLQLLLNGEMQSRPDDMKSGAMRNYPGLQPYLPDRYFDFPFIGGRIYINLKESQMMLARCLGVYETDKTQSIQEYLKPDQTFVDIGANKGDFSLLAAKMVGSKGAVLAFEPEPDNCGWIRKSIALNNYENIEVFEAALGGSNEEVELFIGEKSGWHSLVKSQGDTDNRSINVTKHTLDSILENSNISAVDMIKIDVEGAEMEVLHGAEQTLDNNHDLILLIDIHPHMDVDPVEVCDFLSEKGFSILNIKSPHNEIPTIDKNTKEILARRL